MTSALDLEPEIRDLTRLALLAKQQLFRAIGELQCEDRQYVELPDAETADLAILVARFIQIAG
jgi:hypothetical protein